MILSQAPLSQPQENLAQLPACQVHEDLSQAPVLRTATRKVKHWRKDYGGQRTSGLILNAQVGIPQASQESETVSASHLQSPRTVKKLICKSENKSKPKMNRKKPVEVSSDTDASDTGRLGTDDEDFENLVQEQREEKMEFNTLLDRGNCEKDDFAIVKLANKSTICYYAGQLCTIDKESGEVETQFLRCTNSDRRSDMSLYGRQRPTYPDMSLYGRQRPTYPGMSLYGRQRPTYPGVMSRTCDEASEGSTSRWYCRHGSKETETDRDRQRPTETDISWHNEQDL